MSNGNSKQKLVEVTPEMHRRLKTLAALEGRLMRDVVQVALNMYVTTHEAQIALKNKLDAEAAEG